MEDSTIVTDSQGVAPAPPELAPGTLVGERYRLLQELGRGAMGCVHRAWDAEAGRLVAVKLVDRESTIAPRFRRGSKGLLQLRHPGICEATACGRHGGLDYLVTRYYAGVSLDIALRWLGRWEAPNAVRLTISLLEAIAYLHRQGYVHRDVKPSNILLTSEGRPILADFDLAKPFAANPPDSGVFSREALASSLRESAGCLSGTPLYLPLERLRGLPAEPGDDLYAAALVLYQLLTAQLPTDRSDYRDLASLCAAREEPVTPPSQLGAELPRPLERVILRALSPSPEDRYETGEEFIAALRSGECPSGFFRALSSHSA